MSGRYRIERLPNGLLHVFDRVAKLAACYDTHGRHVSGDLRLTSSVLAELTTKEKGIEQMEKTSAQAKHRLPGCSGAVVCGGAAAGACCDCARPAGS